MKIAISTDGIFVSEHFGRCPKFTLVDIENEKLVKLEEIENPGHQPGNIPKFLHNNGVQCIVCGGMGSRAVGFFNEFNIKIVTGVSGKIDDVVNKLIKGTLVGGNSPCKPGAGKGYGIDKTVCDHED